MKGLLLDPETHDLMVANGTLQVGSTEQQSVALLLETSPGEWKERPTLGADARRQLGGTPDPFWTSATQKMLRAIGLDVKSVTMAADGTVEIE